MDRVAVVLLWSSTAVGWAARAGRNVPGGLRTHQLLFVAGSTTTGIALGRQLVERRWRSSVALAAAVGALAALPSSGAGSRRHAQLGLSAAALATLGAMT